MDKIQIKPEDYLSKKTNPAPHERGYWAGETAKMLGRTVKQVLGLTRAWPLERLRNRFLECSKADQPARLWWGLRKKDKTISTAEHLHPIPKEVKLN